jgi:hypothetical protein
MFTILRRRGNQSKFDIAEIASELVHCHGRCEPLSVLFEWSEVSFWPFEAPSAIAVRDWKQRALSISRAAILHNPKLTRHVAILSALMRVCEAEVRCFHPAAYDQAVEWLSVGPQSSAFDGRQPCGDERSG